VVHPPVLLAPAIALSDNGGEMAAASHSEFGREEGALAARVLTVDFGTPSYKFTVNICTYLIF
jgi:hypothetical protein